MFVKTMDDEEIQSICVDLTEELKRFGTILHVHTEKDLDMFMIKFENANAAANAADLLNDRYYSGRTVSAVAFPNQNYTYE